MSLSDMLYFNVLKSDYVVVGSDGCVNTVRLSMWSRNASMPRLKHRETVAVWLLFCPPGKRPLVILGAETMEHDQMRHGLRNGYLRRLFTKLGNNVKASNAFRCQHYSLFIHASEAKVRSQPRNVKRHQGSIPELEVSLDLRTTLPPTVASNLKTAEGILNHNGVTQRHEWRLERAAASKPKYISRWQLFTSLHFHPVIFPSPASNLKSISSRISTHIIFFFVHFGGSVRTLAPPFSFFIHSPFLPITHRAMDSETDLLLLPIESEHQRDRHYNYPTDWHTQSPSNWRKTKYFKELSASHYDNIPRIQLLISDLDLCITKLSKGANPDLRTRQLRANRARLVHELHALEAGWRNISAVLRTESQKLFILPRELREEIYGYLYTLDYPFVLTYPDIDIRRSMLRRDPFLYLHANIVDPVIAAEAAQIMYNSNVFEISSQIPNQVLHFLRTDHYGSGVLPRDVIRRMHLSTQATLTFGGVRHEVLEIQQRSKPWSVVTRRYTTRRWMLMALLEMQQLRILNLELVCRNSNVYEYREISPTLKMLKERGVVVKVCAVADMVDGWREDISEYFDTPSERDVEVMVRDGIIGPEHPVVDEDPDDWTDDLFPREWSPSRWRVFLEEHYKVFKRRELEEKTKHDIRWLKTVSKLHKPTVVKSVVYLGIITPTKRSRLLPQTLGHEFDPHFQRSMASFRRLNCGPNIHVKLANARRNPQIFTIYPSFSFPYALEEVGEYELPSIKAIRLHGIQNGTVLKMPAGADKRSLSSPLGTVELEKQDVGILHVVLETQVVVGLAMAVGIEVEEWEEGSESVVWLFRGQKLLDLGPAMGFDKSMGNIMPGSLVLGGYDAGSLWGSEQSLSVVITSVEFIPTRNKIRTSRTLSNLLDPTIRHNRGLDAVHLASDFNMTSFRNRLPALVGRDLGTDRVSRNTSVTFTLQSQSPGKAMSQNLTLQYSTFDLGHSIPPSNMTSSYRLAMSTKLWPIKATVHDSDAHRRNLRLPLTQARQQLTDSELVRQFRLFRLGVTLFLFSVFEKTRERSQFQKSKNQQTKFEKGALDADQLRQSTGKSFETMTQVLAELEVIEPTHELVATEPEPTTPGSGVENRVELKIRSFLRFTLTTLPREASTISPPTVLDSVSHSYATASANLVPFHPHYRSILYIIGRTGESHLTLNIPLKLSDQLTLSPFRCNGFLEAFHHRAFKRGSSGYNEIKGRVELKRAKSKPVNMSFHLSRQLYEYIRENPKVRRSLVDGEVCLLYKCAVVTRFEREVIREPEGQILNIWPFSKLGVKRLVSELHFCYLNWRKPQTCRNFNGSIIGSMPMEVGVYHVSSCSFVASIQN
ncbi:uncharacterized protein BDR25DRAFT_363293 [Lindgomyces ingoldianus]|uniref:Uncharacterized protein n=1 Tax=Lindgomyces ingoldianus TaxID=673940 RepID=A0ACB6Q7Z4_9PLEO|nr:uncharacterized protein BDR25DRAFT_363293 [Lindgomyces ingoldianus]KAF2462960.1 hypothetical protein BDR25DRAFT_363293 [Lindgomyces ingoldianus]